MIGSNCISVATIDDSHFNEIKEFLKHLKSEYESEQGFKNQSTKFYIELLTIMSKTYCEEKGFIEKDTWDIETRSNKTIELMKEFESNKGYQLNIDNFIKIALILQKARNNLPINIMGETGCGKTYLIKFLIEVIMRDVSCFEDKRDDEKENQNEIIFNSIKTMHFGVTYYDFIKFILLGFAKAHENNKKIVWLFFDEFNTSQYQSFINEMMSDKNISIKYDFIKFKEMMGISTLPDYVENYLEFLKKESTNSSNLIESNYFYIFLNIISS